MNRKTIEMSIPTCGYDRQWVVHLESELPIHQQTGIGCWRVNVPHIPVELTKISNKGWDSDST